jgi:uncharacterized coiled-coil protein SlyX
MEDQVQNEQAPEMTAEEAQQPTIEGLQAQLQQQQMLMEQQNQAYQNQMNKMMESLGAMVRGGVQQTHAEPEPPRAVMPPGFENLDMEDPYVAPVATLAQHMAQQNAELTRTVSQLQNQLNDQLMASQRREITGNVESALTKYKVPDELKDLARTTVFALMHSSDGKNIDADTMVRNYMQQVGKYTEGAFKRRAEEAKQPKSLASVMRSAGVPKEAPKSWDDAKAASLAFIKAMRG